jgi:type I restriction enzyme, S subunit
MTLVNEYCTIDDLGRIERGKSKHRPRNDPELYDGNYPFIQTGDVKRAGLYVDTYTQTYNEKGLTQSKLWQPGVLCITIAANIAETAILKLSACFPDSIIGFTPRRNKSDVRFVKYCLDGYKLQIQAISQGTTQDNLSLEKLRTIRFKKFTFPIQRKIAAVLSAYDDLIENNNRRTAILEKMAEEIYREWFVRMRFPGHEKTKFRKGVPEGWEAVPLNKFCLLQRGYDLPDDKVRNGKYPVMAATSIKTFHNEFRVEPPMVTTGRSGSLGIVLFTRKRAWPLNTTLYVKSYFGNSPYLVFYTLKNLHLENFNSGAGVPTLNRNHLQCISMPVPPKSMQAHFDRHLDPIFKDKEALETTTANLTISRDLLLARLITGKLSVEDLDIRFPPSMRSPEHAEEKEADG